MTNHQSESSNHDIDKRMEELEYRSAHQELTQDNLTSGVVEQQQQIAKLTTQVKYLQQQLKRFEETMPGSESAEPPPPHY